MKPLILVITMLISLSAIADNNEHETIAIGLGFGVPYGGLGTKMEYRPFKELSLSGGIGTMLKGKGYSYGAIFNMWKLGPVEPRLSIYRATNAILIEANSGDTEVFAGNNIGIGFQQLKGNRAVSLDLIYILSSGIFDRIKELETMGISPTKPSRVKIALGYHWLF